MSAIPHTLERWRLQWQQRPRHERHVFAALAALVVVALLWLWGWYPLTQHLALLHQQLPSAQARLDEARSQWAESTGLLLQKASPTTADARTAIERSAARFGIAGTITALDVQKESATLTLSALPFDTLVQWLEQLQGDEHFYLTHATLTPLTAASSGNLRAELVIVRPSF